MKDFTKVFYELLNITNYKHRSYYLQQLELLLVIICTLIYLLLVKIINTSIK